MMRFLKLIFAGSIGISVAAATALAQGYPTHSVTLIVPFAAGGPSDTIARILTKTMEKSIGQPIVIENVKGAGGTIGVRRASEATPDGYTIVFGHMGTFAAAVGLYPHLAYDPSKNFDPIGLTALTPVLIIARKDLPPKNLKEFVAYVKANESKVQQGHGGVGSISNLACLLLDSMLGIKPTSIPYNGSGPALNALISGEVDYICSASGVSQVAAGIVKAYAITTPERSPALPNVPTTKEAGLPEYDVVGWTGLFAPHGTPTTAIRKLADALNVALDDPSVGKQFQHLAVQVPIKDRRGPQFLVGYVKGEIKRWAPIAKAAKR
jgi:putative tricarboxylic transport membrane protein